MHRLARLSPRFLSCALLLAPGLAAAEEPVAAYPACTKMPTDGDIAAAKGAFQAGNASFNEADYQRAITYWEDAYRRDCTAHINLLNLARAYELHGLKLHAANALETFLARSPGTADESQIKRRIEKLRAPDPAAAPEPAVAPAVEKKPEEPAPPPPVTEAPTEPVAEKPVTGGRRSLVPLVVAGVGGAVAIGGTILWATARSDVDDARKDCTPERCDPADAERGNDARERAMVSGWIAGAGGVVLAGGLVWYFVQKPPAQTASAPPRGFAARVTPSFGASYGGVEVIGRF